MKLSESEKKYLLRAEVAPEGYVRPASKTQLAVCEALRQKGLFVLLLDGCYTKPEIADDLGLERST